MKPTPEIHLGGGMRVSVVEYSGAPTCRCIRPVSGSLEGATSCFLADAKEIRRFLKVSQKTPSRASLDEFLDQHFSQPATPVVEEPADPTENTRTII
jgi:hypothetical protein